MINDGNISFVRLLMSDYLSEENIEENSISYSFVEREISLLDIFRLFSIRIISFNLFSHDCSLRTNIWYEMKTSVEKKKKKKKKSAKKKKKNSITIANNIKGTRSIKREEEKFRLFKLYRTAFTKYVSVYLSKDSVDKEHHRLKMFIFRWIKSRFR